MEFNVLALPNNGVQHFGFLNTGIQCFAFPTSCGYCFFFNMGSFILWLFQTLEFSVLPFANIRVQEFCFS